MNKVHSANVVRRWPNIEPTLVQYAVFTEVFLIEEPGG